MSQFNWITDKHIIEQYRSQIKGHFHYANFFYCSQISTWVYVFTFGEPRPFDILFKGTAVGTATKDRNQAVAPSRLRGCSKQNMSSIHYINL